LIDIIFDIDFVWITGLYRDRCRICQEGLALTHPSSWLRNCPRWELRQTKEWDLQKNCKQKNRI